jgi:hypothetical protein
VVSGAREQLTSCGSSVYTPPIPNITNRAERCVAAGTDDPLYRIRQIGHRYTGTPPLRRIDAAGDLAARAGPPVDKLEPLAPDSRLALACHRDSE